MATETDTDTRDLRPHIGRIVTYVVGAEDDTVDRPAVITDVQADTPDNDSPVDLTVWTPTGDLRPRSVEHDGSEHPAAGTWHWPRPTTLDTK